MRRLCVSLALTTTSISSTAAASASSAPFTLGTRARNTTPGRRVIPAITSAAPAMGGIAAGLTNETASIRRSPVALSASMSRIRSSTGTVASFCRPSRGPTSPISTAPGHLDIAAQATGRSDQSWRRRTRILMGVGPRSNASRTLRSTYRRYVGGSIRVAKSVNVGGSAAPCVA